MMNSAAPLATLTATRNMLASVLAVPYQLYLVTCWTIGLAFQYLRRAASRFLLLDDSSSVTFNLADVEEIPLQEASMYPPRRTLSSDTSYSTLESRVEMEEDEDPEEQEDWRTATLRRLQENDPYLTELDLDASIYEAQQQQQLQEQRNDDFDVILQAKDVQNLAQALQENTSVTHLTLRNLTVASPAHIMALVEGIPQLKSLHLEDTRGVGLETVARILASKNPSLRCLPPSRPLFSPSPVLLDHLRELRLNHAPIPLSVVKALSQGLPYCTRLQRLDFQGSRLDDHSMGHLCKALATHKSVAYWCLDFNSFGDLGMQAMGHLLTHNTSLKELHLFGNSITDVGATHLAQALPHNTSLQSLVLSLNDMGDRGVAALAYALTLNTSLQKLWMPSNNVGNRGLEAVAQHLRHWKGLQELNLGDSFDLTAAQAILKALPHNYVLRKLYLESPVYECEQTDAQIDFYLRLNQCGRQHWFNQDVSHPALWAQALAKCYNYADVRGSPDVLCYLLQHRPTLCEQPAHNQCPTRQEEEN